MYDTNSNDSLYDACYEDGTTSVLHTNKRCPKRRRYYYYVKNDVGLCDRPIRSNSDDDDDDDDADRRSCRKCCNRCCGRGASSSSAFTAVIRWTRTAIDWIVDKKSHIAVAVISFVLGAFFGDYCNCLYAAAGDSENGGC